MQYSDNVEDGEIEEENELKGPPVESKFSISLQSQSREGENNGEYLRGSGIHENRPGDDFRQSQDKRCQDHRYPPMHGGGHHGRPFVRPPPPQRPPQMLHGRGLTAPIAASPQHRFTNPALYPPEPPRGGFMPHPMPVDMGRVEIGTSYTPPMHVPYAPPSAAFPRPPPITRPPLRVPPAVAPAWPVKPSMGDRVATSHNAVDVEMEEAFSAPMDPPVKLVVPNIPPPAIVTDTGAFPQTEGISGQVATMTPNRSLSDNKYAVGTPMPSAAVPPTFHQYASAVSGESLLRATPRQAKPLIKVVSDPNKASVDAIPGEGTTVILTGPAHVPSSSAPSADNLLRASQSRGAQSRPSSGTATAAPRPLGRTQSTSSLPDSHASTSLAHIMDAIGNGPIASSLVHTSPATTSQAPLSPRSHHAADDGPLSSTHVSQTLASTTPGVVKVGNLSVGGIAIDSGSSSAADAVAAVTSFPPETTSATARRPRLAWGQGLRRRTSGPTDIDPDKGGDEASGSGPVPGATVGRGLSADVSHEHDLDRISDVPNLTFGRSKSEILSPTHKSSMDSSYSIVGDSPAVGAGPVTANREVVSAPVDAEDNDKIEKDNDADEDVMQEEENAVSNVDDNGSGNDDFSGNEKGYRRAGDDVNEDDRIDDDHTSARAGVDEESAAGTDIAGEPNVVITVSEPSPGVELEPPKLEEGTTRPKGRPGRPALSDEAKAQKKAERKAKKKAQAEKDVISGSRRKSSKGSYDPGEYDSGSDWDGEPGSKKMGRRGRPRTTGDSDAESGEGGEAPKKKRGRPPNGKTAGASLSAGDSTVLSAGEVAPVPQQRRASKGRTKKGSKSDIDIPSLAVPVKRRSRSFGSFERDSLGSIFTQMPDWRNAYYALQGMVRIQVGMRGMHGFDREDLRGLSEMLQNPRSVVNLPIPYTSEIMMCLDIIEAQSHHRTDALMKLLLMKDELEEMLVRKEGRRSATAVRGQGTITDIASTGERADQTTIDTRGSMDTNRAAASIPLATADMAPASCASGFASTTEGMPLVGSVSGSSRGGNFTVKGSTVPQNPITTMRKAYEKADQGKRPISSFIPLPDPKVAVPILKANMKLAKVANIHAHIIPPVFSSQEDRAYIARQVHLNRADIKRNRSVIMEEIRRRKLNRSRAWEILGDRYVSVKHQWEHNLKHTVPTENEEEDLMAPRLRALSAMRQSSDDAMGSPRVARISALRATSDMCKSDVDQDKILQQMAMIELKQRRLKYGIATIVDMLSPWQNADSSIPPVAPTFPVKGMQVPDFDYMGSLDEKQDTSGFIKSEEFPAYVSEPPVIVDLNGSRLTTDGKRQMCSALVESKNCPPSCNCAKQVDKLERQCRPWSDIEKCIFVDKFMQFPKNFSKIAAYLVNRTTKDCIKFYYDSKTTIPFKSLLREFDNRKRNLKNSWTHTCAVATSVGGAVYPPEDVDEKEQLYELPMDDISYSTLCSHPQYMAAALGFESSSPEEIGSYRRKQVKYMQALPPRHSTQLLNERRAWKRESAAAGSQGSGQTSVPQYMGLSGGPGASRKFGYPSGGVHEESSASSCVTAPDTQYRGYAQSDSGWLERNRSLNLVRQRKPKEPVESGVFISSELIGQERKVEVLSTSPTGTIGRGGRGRGRRGRRPNTPGRGGGRAGPREAPSGNGSTLNSVSTPGDHSGTGIVSSTGRGRGRGRGRGTRGRGRGRGRSSHKAESDSSGYEQGEGEEGEVAVGGGGEEEMGVGTSNEDNEEDLGENEDGGDGDNAEEDVFAEEDCDGMSDGGYADERDDNDLNGKEGDDTGSGTCDICVATDDCGTGDIAVVKCVSDTSQVIEKAAVPLTAPDTDSGSMLTTASISDPLLPSERAQLTEAEVTSAQLPVRATFIIDPASASLLQSGTTLSINSAPLSGISLPPPDALPMSPGSLPVPTDATAILPFFPPPPLDSRIRAQLTSHSADSGEIVLETPVDPSSEGTFRNETKESPRAPCGPVSGVFESESCEDVADRKRKSSNISTSRSVATDDNCGDEESRAPKRVATGEAHPQTSSDEDCQ